VRRLTVPIVMAVLALTPAPAFAGAQDAASTHAAITAGYALARAAVATIPVAQAKIQSYKRRLARECPDVGAGTPETEASEPMSAEVAAALWSISYGAAAGPIERFARAIRPLRWTSKRFERSLHSFVTALTGLATLPLPDLCADVRSWTASGFKTVPRDVTELDQHVERLELGEVAWGLVAPYERGSEAGLVSYIEGAVTKVEEAEFELGQKDWYEVLETLGLAP
jgi:hypothetical protein